MGNAIAPHTVTTTICVFLVAAASPAEKHSGILPKSTDGTKEQRRNGKDRGAIVIEVTSW